MNKDLAYALIKELSGDNEDKIDDKLNLQVQRIKRNFQLDDKYRLYF